MHGLAPALCLLTLPNSFYCAWYHPCPVIVKEEKGRGTYDLSFYNHEEFYIELMQSTCIKEILKFELAARTS